jgi:hypothetical protein
MANDRQHVRLAFDCRSNWPMQVGAADWNANTWSPLGGPDHDRVRWPARARVWRLLPTAANGLVLEQ